MKHLSLFFVTTLLVMFSQTGISQIIYSDNFDHSNLTIEPTTNVTPTLSNNNLTLSGNGSTEAFEAIGYAIHNEGTGININVQSSPVLYIRAKGTNNPLFRIDMQDEGGFTTNNQTTSIELTENFQTFELNFTNKFQDGGFGGPCAKEDAPCPVDPTNIKQLLFFIQPNIGNYNGTIEIDWISIGASLDAPSVPTEFDIRYNQVSYLTGRDKFINIVTYQNTFADKSYSVTNSQGTEILSGTTSASRFWDDSREHIATVDVSSIDTEGTYTFSIAEKQIDFKVSKDGYADLREETFKYYYYNRASTALDAAHAGQYARPAGHPDTRVFVHSSAASAARPEGFEISSPKGWYDAGDYNKYIVNSGISTYTLLAAYEHYKEYYDKTTFSIPEEGGNIPDILDETIWNLDWMLTMQDPNDGGVYHKLTDKLFSANVMPNGYTADRFVVQKTTSAALNFAAVTAVASRLFKEFEADKPGYSLQLLQASESAYAWAKANPSIFYVQPDDIKTGEYGDRNVNDEFQWAAVELFITTKQNVYKNDIDVNNIFGGVPEWPYVSPLALVSIAHHNSSLAAASINVQPTNKQLTDTADEIRDAINGSPMKVGMNGSFKSFVWGSNGNAGNQLFILIRAFELTGDESYLDAAFVGMDYIFGRNGTGFSFVTGFGDKTPQNPHHRISFADGIDAPLPGMIVGGPQPGQEDNEAGRCPGYPNNNPASSYLDEYCSFSTNEITINWNAPLVYVMNALHFYQNEENILSVDDVTTPSEELVSVYPNPTNNVLNIRVASNVGDASVTLYNVQGKQLHTQSVESNITRLEIANMTAGIYVAKIVADNKTYIKKIIKN